MVLGDALRSRSNPLPAAGRVHGMIFAASSDNPEESYALAEDEINLAISRARARVQPVDTGACAL